MVVRLVGAFWAGKSGTGDVDDVADGFEAGALVDAGLVRAGGGEEDQVIAPSEALSREQGGDGGGESATAKGRQDADAGDLGGPVAGRG